jgi:hypothetical protein
MKPKYNTIIVAFMFGSLATQAANILTNPGFEADGNHGSGSPITGWHGTPSGPWYINSDYNAHSGGNYYKVWGAFNGSVNVQSVYQDNSALPTSTYSASGWLNTPTNSVNPPGNDILWSGDDADYAWIEVSFRDASDNILALYKSDIFSDTLSSHPGDYSAGPWFSFQVTNICDITPPYPVIGHTNVLAAPAGTFKVRYQMSIYQLLYGGGAGYFDDAVLNQLSGPQAPQITQVYPGTMLFATNAISFHVISPSGTPVSTGNIHLVVNGTDVSAGCQFSGSSPDIAVVYTNLVPNTWAYSASITVTDAFSLNTSASMNFDTVTPAYVWEAEDYDFTNGLSIDFPLLSSTEQPGSYYGLAGTLGTDFSGNGNNAQAPNLYRTNDHSGLGPASESARQKFLTAQLTDPGVQDYTVGYIRINDFMNYTHNYPAGTYNIYARLAGGAGATTVALSNLTSGTLVGNFQFTGSDWGGYHYIPLVDTNGNLLPFNFNGSRQTLSVTLISGGDNMNFFMLAPAQVGLPFLSNINPANGTVFADTNTFSFTADSSAGINNSGIHLTLNGVDVTSHLSISGGANTKNVSAPLLVPNNVYTAVIAVTNNSNVGVTRTILFDTMNSGNFYVKGSDFDYSGGQWDTAFNGLQAYTYYQNNSAYTNIDFSSPPSGGAYPFRNPGLATEITADVPLPGWLVGGDYDVGYFNNGDWGNYTRDYPAGKYLAYGRLAGGNGNLTAYLDQVTSGVGTTTQTTRRLGTWRANTGGWQAWAWVQLTDPGLSSPVVVNVGGTNTLRVTSGGNVNFNYFMLVPVQGFTISATRSGNNVLVSFPTQLGANYRVFYRPTASGGNWTLLTTVAGDGTVKSVSDPITASTRYYKVTSP